MKYKVGDRIRIKSLDWYNENKNEDGRVACGYHIFTKDMSKFCGCTMIVCNRTNLGVMTMGGSASYWTDEMIEGLVEEEMIDLTSIVMETVEEKTIQNALTYGYNLPEGYQFVDENSNVINATKIVLEKKKKEYPKTYEECCEIMNVIMETEIVADAYLERLAYYELNLDTKIENLRKLIICRDAYWKIAGDEMGSGKPWEPDWTNDNAKYSIYTIKGVLTKAISCYDGAIFVFPTPEMRDAFYENFKELIEQCKELL